MPNANNKVLLEMSGGLDSSAAAIVLQDQGYDVLGVMMRLHDSEAFDTDLQIAKEVTKRLDIDFHVIDFRERFKKEVINYFVNTYKEAKTPNPCIICNQKMKFGAIFDVAKKLSYDKIATGHYARIVRVANIFELHKAKDSTKDQSYVLHFLDQDKLSKIIFPLGEHTKTEVRQIAREAGLPCADKEESMDICFVDNKTYPEFIMENSDYNPEPGNVVNASGDILGKHNGLINYTIGQRKGLGLAFSEPMYVLSLDKAKNEVVLGTKDETFTNVVNVSNFSWVSGKAPSEKFKCQAKLRYRQKPRDCIVSLNETGVQLEYPEGIDSVTPGQFAVLYDGNKVLGGGIIV